MHASLQSLFLPLSLSPTHAHSRSPFRGDVLLQTASISSSSSAGHCLCVRGRLYRQHHKCLAWQLHRPPRVRLPQPRTHLFHLLPPFSPPALPFDIFTENITYFIIGLRNIFHPPTLPPKRPPAPPTFPHSLPKRILQFPRKRHLPLLLPRQMSSPAILHRRTRRLSEPRLPRRLRHTGFPCTLFREVEVHRVERHERAFGRVDEAWEWSI